MKLTRATKTDLARVMAIIQDGKQQLASRGIDQWQNEYPGEQIVRHSIDEHHTFLVEADDEKTVGTLTIQQAPDEAYAHLDGKWRIDTDAYVTIHRVVIHSQHAGKGYATQLFKAVINYIITHSPQLKSIRIDTHQDNKPMQNLLEKLGFVQVGLLNEVYSPGEISVAYEYLTSQGLVSLD